MKIKSNYEKLGLSLDASFADVQKRYRELAIKFHPDRFFGPSEQFIEIQEAYEAIRRHHEREEPALDPNNNSLLNSESALTEIYNHPDIPLLIDFDFSAIYSYFKIFEFSDKAIATFNALPLTAKINYFDELKDRFGDISRHDDPIPQKDSSYTTLTQEQKIAQRIINVIEEYKNIKPIVNEKAFVYLLTKKDHGDIYLFSTCHLLTEDPEQRFGDPCRNLFSKVDVAFTEIDFNDSCSEFTHIIRGQPFYELDKYLNHEFLVMHPERRVEVLEDATIRIMVSQVIPNPNQAAEPSNVPSQKQTESILLEFYGATDKKTVEILTANFLTNISPQSQSYLAKRGELRSKLWMQKILDTSSGGHSSIVMVGAAHMLGKNGLPNLFANKGYAVTPIMKQAPTAKSEILNTLVYQDNNLIFTLPTAIQEKPFKLQSKK